MSSMFQHDFEAFVAEHERIHGRGVSRPLYPLPPQQTKPQRTAEPVMVQIDLEQLIAEDIAAEAAKASSQPQSVVSAETPADPSVSVVTMAAEAPAVHGEGRDYHAPAAGEADAGEGGENRPALSLGFKTVDFQNGNLNTASAPLVMRTVQALHDPGEGIRKPPICYCGAPRLGAVDVHLREDGGKKKASVTGIWRCRNGEVCPHCAEAATARRRDSYARVGGAAIEKGGSIVTLVLSVSHSVKDRLADLMRAVKKASTGARAGGTWTRSIKPTMGCTGVLVDHHVRHGALYGWHYHQHLTFFCVGKTAAEIEAALAKLVERYVGLITRQGFRADAARQHIKILQQDHEGSPYTYPADHNAGAGGGEAMEITATDHGEEESLSPLMLADRAARGDEQAAALFMEFSAAIKGTRSVVVTPGLTKALEIAPKADEDPIYTEKTLLGSIPGPVWIGLIDRDMTGTFLTRVEAAGRAGWRAIRWWALEQTGMAPVYSVALAKEVAELTHARKRMDDPIAKELADDQIGILKSDWTYSHGDELVAATLEYVAAHYRHMAVDEHTVEFWVSVLETNADKIARRRRDAASHMTLSMGDSPPSVSAVSQGLIDDHVGRFGRNSHHA